MLKTLQTTTNMFAKTLTKTSSRTIMTFANEQVQNSVMQAAAKQPELMEKIKVLKASPRTFHVFEGVGKFDHNKLEVQIRPESHHQHQESIPHEIFHATHYETIRASKTQEVADMVFDSSAHRPVIEKGALIFGKRMIGTASRKAVDDHYAQYVKEGYLKEWSQESEDLVDHRYHTMVKKEFDEL
jgi:hypothetical protein